MNKQTKNVKKQLKYDVILIRRSSGSNIQWLNFFVVSELATVQRHKRNDCGRKKSSHRANKSHHWKSTSSI